MQACLDYARPMRLRPPLALEIAAARGVGGLSRRLGRRRRHDDPGQAPREARPRRDRPPRRAAPGRDRRRLGDEREDDHDRDGGRDPAPAVPARAQRRRREPRLGRRLDAARRRRRRARALRGGRGGAAGGRATPAAARGLPREPLPRPARPLRRARAGRRALARGGRRAARGGRSSSSTPTTRSSPRSARARPGSVAFGLDDPRVARPSLQHAADSKYCVRCGTPYDYAAAYVGHLGDYRCPSRPPRAAAARGRRAGRSSSQGLERPRSGSSRPEGSRRDRARACPGSTTSTTRVAAAALARALGADARRDRGRARALLRRVRPLRAHRRSARSASSCS